MHAVMEQAQKELAQTGRLSVSTRQQLWLALGPAEVTDRDPCPLTEAVQKRAQLALACGKKVSRVWAAYDAQDKRPQTLLRQTSAYLQGKCTAEKLDRLLKDTNFMPLMDEERYSSAPLAALAAYWGAVAALYDEPLLDSARLGCKEEQLDFYDWDAAWCAALAWAGRDENAGTGKQRVEEMKFWAWYLEQAAELMGEENYCFPKKEIKKFQEQQDPPVPVPEQADLEHFVQFMGLGDLQYCVRQKSDQGYVIQTIQRSMEAVCPVCGVHITQPKFWYGVNCLDDAFPKNGPPIHLLKTVPMLHCPKHQDALCRNIDGESINPKAAWKRYLSVPGRAEEFLAELERRTVNAFQIGNAFISLNQYTAFHHNLPIPEEIKGIRWMDREMEEMEIDLTAFGPHVYFNGVTLEEFCRCYSDKVQMEKDGVLLITMERHWIRCELDENGALVRVIIRSRFCIRFDKRAEKMIKIAFLTEDQSRILSEILHLPTQEALRLPWEELCSRLSGLTRPQALAIWKDLQSHKIFCDILPNPLG